MIKRLSNKCMSIIPSIGLQFSNLCTQQGEVNVPLLYLVTLTNKRRKDNLVYAKTTNLTSYTPNTMIYVMLMLVHITLFNL